MSAHNLHRIYGSVFQHVKAPCATCAFRKPHGEWEGYCTARGKVLSWREPERQSKRCADYTEVTPEPTNA